MAIPSGYTEQALAAYMHDVLGAVGTSLDFSVTDGDYAEAVNDALVAYGVDDIQTVSGRANIARLRALARVEAWRLVVRNTAGDYDFQADGARYNRSQIHAQAQENLQEALNDAAAYDPSYRVGIDRIVHKHDPYAYLPEEDRTP